MDKSTAPDVTSRNGTSERSGATCVLFGQTGVAKERRFEQQRGNAGYARWAGTVPVHGAESHGICDFRAGLRLAGGHRMVTDCSGWGPIPPDPGAHSRAKGPGSRLFRDGAAPARMP